MLSRRVFEKQFLQASRHNLNKYTRILPLYIQQYCTYISTCAWFDIFLSTGLKTLF